MGYRGRGSRAWPIQYVMVHAPRNEEEIMVVVGIMKKAAARYALGGSLPIHSHPVSL